MKFHVKIPNRFREIGKHSEEATFSAELCIPVPWSKLT